MHCITGTQCNPGKGKPADARNKTRLCQTISLYKLLCNPWILRVWGSIYTECVKAAVYGWKNQLYKYSLLLNHNGSNWYKRKFWIAKEEHWFFFWSEHTVKFCTLSDRNYWSNSTTSSWWNQKGLTRDLRATLLTCNWPK